MARLHFIVNTSLDGYIADEHGNFDWSEPDDELHLFFNDFIRPIGTYLYGRLMYETMAAWETEPSLVGESPIMRDFAETWQEADKIVYSRTLESAPTARTRIAREFDPEAVRALKAAAEKDIAIGGPNLATHAFRSGLVDECHMVLLPVIVGGGNRALPDRVRLDLELLEERRFGNGSVYLRHRVKP